LADSLKGFPGGDLVVGISPQPLWQLVPAVIASHIQPNQKKTLAWKVKQIKIKEDNQHQPLASTWIFTQM
jgi:hypothetical protein